MQQSYDPGYYARRAVKAKALADAALDPMIAKIHREMAAGYLKLAALTDEGKPPLYVVSG